MSDAQRLVLRHDLDAYPGIARFALDVVKNRGTARDFLLRGRGAQIAPVADTPGRDAVAADLLESNRSWGNDVEREVSLWRSGGAITLVAGQQVGFGGGPLYTLAKLASLLSLRDRCRRNGQDAVVFFWLATEDHDFAEVATITLPSSEGTRTFRAAERPTPGRVVGSLPLPGTLVAQIRKHDPSLAGAWCDDGVTFRDSFARLLSRCLEGEGVVLVDALLPALRRAGAGLFHRMVAEWDAVQQALRARESDLTDAGYSPQVISEDDHALLWLIDDEAIRRPVRSTANGTFTIGDASVDREALLQTIAERPERVSTGALMRPLLQDQVLGSDVFVGGPAEVSYYAQSEAAHRLLDVRPPVVMLRGHALVAPVRLLESATRRGFSVEEMYEEPSDVLARRERPAVEAWRDSIERAERTLHEDLLAASGTVVDSAGEMRDSIARSLRRIDYHLRRMRERGVRAIARGDSERARALERAHLALAPGGVPQDRIVAWLPLFERWRGELLAALVECAEPNSDSVAVIGLEG